MKPPLLIKELILRRNHLVWKHLVSIWKKIKRGLGLLINRSGFPSAVLLGIIAEKIRKNNKASSKEAPNRSCGRVMQRKKLREWIFNASTVRKVQNLLQRCLCFIQRHQTLIQASVSNWKHLVGLKLLPNVWGSKGDNRGFSPPWGDAPEHYFPEDIALGVVRNR